MQIRLSYRRIVSLLRSEGRRQPRTNIRSEHPQDRDDSARASTHTDGSSARRRCLETSIRLPPRTDTVRLCAPLHLHHDPGPMHDVYPPPCSGEYAKPVAWSPRGQASPAFVLFSALPMSFSSCSGPPSNESRCKEGARNSSYFAALDCIDAASRLVNPSMCGKAPVTGVAFARDEGKDLST